MRTRCFRETLLRSIVCQFVTLEKTLACLCGQCHRIVASHQFEIVNAGFTSTHPLTPPFFLLPPEHPPLLRSPPSLHSPFLFVSLLLTLWCRVEQEERGAKPCRAAQNSCCWTLDFTLSQASLQIPSLHTVSDTFKYKKLLTPSLFPLLTITPSSYFCFLSAPTCYKLLFSAFHFPPASCRGSSFSPSHFPLTHSLSSPPPTFYKSTPSQAFSLIPPSDFFFLLCREDLG